MIDMTGKRCVVTGAARGLGRALAVSLARCGADLVLAARSQAALKNTASEIRQITDVRIETIEMDLANPASVSTAAKVIATNPVDLLINNGAGWLEGNITDNSDAEIVNTVASAITGMAILLRDLSPALARAPAADVVTVVSTSGLSRTPAGSASPAFNAAKRGQAALVEATRPGLTAAGIRSIAVFPPDFDDWNPLISSTLPTDRALDGADVIDCILFALSRRRTVLISDVILGRMDRVGG